MRLYRWPTRARQEPADLVAVKAGVEGQQPPCLVSSRVVSDLNPFHAPAHPQGFEPHPGDSESPVLPITPGANVDNRVPVGTKLSNRNSFLL
jgi:hypothetical protein